MLIPLAVLIQKYHIVLQGVLHVGAHECEEITDYERYVSRDKILWVEAIPEKVEMCRSRHANLLIEHAVVSDVEQEVVFNVSNNGQSSSLLELGMHRDFYPDVYYVQGIRCRTKRLKEIVEKYDIPFNFLNLDIQGAELKALKGLDDYLQRVDYVYTEVNEDFVYQHCALVGELDDYLGRFGLVRVETRMTDNKWGDAFYMRK